MKQKKIIAAVNPDAAIRKDIIERVLIEKGFARIHSDAAKLIKPTVADIDLPNAYFVAADNHRFGLAPITDQILFQMASLGLLVVIGIRHLPQRFEFLCEAYFM